MEEAVASRAEAGSVMSKQALTRVLIDISGATIAKLPNTVSLVDFNASYYDVLPVGSNIACVIPADKNIVTDAKFAETVALNRGISMKICLDRDSALDWLKDL